MKLTPTTVYHNQKVMFKGRLLNKLSPVDLCSKNLDLGITKLGISILLRSS